MSGIKNVGRGIKQGITDLGESFGNLFAGNGFVTNAEVFDQYAAAMSQAVPNARPASSGETFNIYNLNDSRVAARQGGGRYTEDLQEGMVELRNGINEALGTNFTDAAQIQEAYKNGDLSETQIQQINKVATEGMTEAQLTQFSRVYGTAQGLMNGTVGVGNNSYVSLLTGQNIAGMWNGGTVENRIKPTIDINSIYDEVVQNGFYYNQPDELDIKTNFKYRSL